MVDVYILYGDGMVEYILLVCAVRYSRCECAYLYIPSNQRSNPELCDPFYARSVTSTRF